MAYNVIITEVAKRDLLNTLDYIDNILKNPDAADKLLNEFIKKSNGLALFPEAPPIINDPALSEFNVRYVKVMNYLIFYAVRNSNVYIVRFLYKKTDWNTVLKKSYDL